MSAYEYVEEREVNAALRRFEQEHSIKLDPKTAQEMGELMETEDLEAADAYAEVSPAGRDFEADFSASIERIERQQGSLLDGAVELVEGALARRGGPE